MLRIILAVLTILNPVFANSCRWFDQTGKDFLSFDSNLSIVRDLSKDQVVEDLDCLQHILNHHYALTYEQKNTKISNRIDVLKKSVQDSSNRELIQEIFSVHQGYPDFHLNYMIHDDPNSHQRFSRRENVETSYDQEGELDKFLRRDNHLYLRPSTFIEQKYSQKVLIGVIQKKDHNVVIDLRDNGGGEDWFAIEMAKAIFTKEERIPSCTRTQLSSGFFEIGFAKTLFMVSHPHSMRFWDKVKEKYSNKTFQELFNISLDSSNRILKGTRERQYSKRIIILIDGSCGSSCETVVEMLGVHTNTIIIGENTMGALKYSNPMTLMLPNSGIIAQIPTLLHSYEIDSEEGVGYSPDIKKAKIIFADDILSLLL